MTESRECYLRVDGCVCSWTSDPLCAISHSGRTPRRIAHWLRRVASATCQQG